MSPLRVFALLVVLGFSASGAEPGDHPLTPVFSRTCLSCHGPDKQKGDFRVDRLAWPVATEKQAEAWRLVAERLETGEMPPKKAVEQPSAAERKEALASINAELTRVAASLSGSLSSDDILRRLNRQQYQNTLRDLLGIRSNLADQLPEDARAYGFDRIGSALNLSGEQIQNYMAVADYALLDAMPPIPDKPARALHTGSFGTTEGDGKNRKERGDLRVLPDGGVVTFRGKLEVKDIKLPIGGWYKVRIAHAAYQSTKDQVLYAKVASGNSTIGFLESRPGDPVTTEIDVWMGPGGGVSVTPFLDFPPRPWRHDFKDYTGPGLRILSLEIDGPFLDQWPERGASVLYGDLPLKPRDGHGRLFALKSPPGREQKSVTVASQDPLTDATRLMASFLPKAFRRPVKAEEITRFVALASEELKKGKPTDKGSFQSAMQVAYVAALCSPDFLFLKETKGKLDDYAIACRLSYFLIGSMPDDALFAAAKEGKLRQPAGRRAQAERLLASPGSKVFERDFVGQWLDLRHLDSTTPDTKLYPDFDPVLFDAMRQETELFFGDVLQHDLSVMEFVDSDWTYLNSRLAAHYGIPGVSGIEMRKVALPKASHRGGVMTQASVLKVTANGTVTSPVIRGKWLLERIIGRSPPPPPANVAAIETDVRGATSIRDQLAKHRKDPTCATCHVSLDPHGFALENFDVIGGWRTQYRVLSKEGAKLPNVEYKLGLPVEAGDVMPDGRRFTVVDEYKQILQSERDQIARAMIERLMIYSLGRGLTFADRPTIQNILSVLKPKNYGLKAMILELVQSERFAVK
jgi:hypothetical protein